MNPSPRRRPTHRSLLVASLVLLSSIPISRAQAVSSEDDQGAKAGQALAALAQGGAIVEDASPSKTPRVFAPGVVSRGNVHGRLVVSPDSREIFWTTVDLATFTTQILSVRSVDGAWTSPEAPAFARGGKTQGPVFSRDGTRLFFWIDNGEGWAARVVERSGDGWSTPRSTAVAPRSSASFTRAGEVFYSAEMASKVWGSGIFTARDSAEGPTDARPLGPQINIENAIDYTPYVSPDGSFLLFTSNRPTVGDKEEMHLQVTFRDGDGEWSTPVRVTDIEARFPSLSPDGRLLFFCGDDGNIYWVAASILEPLRPPAPAPTRTAAPTPPPR